MCKSRDPFFYTGVIVRARSDARCARYNGHLRGPVTLTPIVERVAVELTLSVFTT